MSGITRKGWLLRQLEKRYDEECGEEADIAMVAIADANASMRSGRSPSFDLNKINEFSAKRSLARFLSLCEIWSPERAKPKTMPGSDTSRCTRG